jgi:hypothetical protein
MRPVARVASGLLAVLALLVPGHAFADEDPGPVTWPSVLSPSAGSASDPKPVQWTTVVKPDVSGPDPRPTDWPQPQPG